MNEQAQFGFIFQSKLNIAFLYVSRTESRTNICTNRQKDVQLLDAPGGPFGTGHKNLSLTHAPIENKMPKSILSGAKN